MLNKMFITFVVAFLGTRIIELLHNVQEVQKMENARRERIIEEATAQLDAMRKARDQILEKIQNGEYEGRGFEALQNDLQFYTVINRTGDPDLD